MKLTTHKGWKTLFLKLANQGPKKGFVFTSYRVPWRVAAVISTHAKKAGTSLTDAVNQIIAAWIAKNPAKPDLTVKVSAHAREPVKAKGKGKKATRKAAKPAKKVKAKTAKKAAPKKTAPKIKAQAKPKAPKARKPKAASKPAEAKPAEPASNGGSAPASREEQHANAVDGLS